MAAKQEPMSPGKEDKGKGKATNQENFMKDASAADGFDMADWVHDPQLWDKIGGDPSGSNLHEPVKTIEVSWSSSHRRETLAG